MKVRWTFMVADSCDDYPSRFNGCVADSPCDLGAERDDIGRKTESVVLLGRILSGHRRKPKRP